MEQHSKRVRRVDARRLQRAWRRGLRDFWVFTELHRQPSGAYGFDRQLVTARTAGEACALSDLDPAHGLAAVPIPSEAEYQAALAGEAERKGGPNGDRR